MNTIMEQLRGILFLEDKTYQAFLSDENPMKRGIIILFICFLIAGFPTAVGQLIDNATPFTQEKAAEFQEEFMRNFDNVLRFMPADPEIELFLETFEANFALGTGIAVKISNADTFFPKPIAGFLQTLGSWLSTPFPHLATWMGYAIWVLLLAKLSGSLGNINRFLGLTALYAVPNLLGFFSFIPFLGPVFTFVGVIWGWAVYVKALEVSQEVSVAKALLLALLPVLILVAIGFIFLIVGITSILISAN